MAFRIRIFSSFIDSAKCKEIYESLCESSTLENYGPNKDIYITNGDDYTHVLILNIAMPVIPSHIPKQNVVGLAFEPIVFLGLTQEFLDYAIKNIGKYFIGDTRGLPLPFTEHFSYMWHNPPPKTSPQKTKLISMILSGKTYLDGHKYRHQLVNQILQTDLPIDIYGSGCKYYKHLNDGRIKGEFIEIEPYDDYHFHICIENCQSNRYFSEKIMNSLLTETVPIYLGCRNIDGYFPGMVIGLTGNIGSDIEMLRQIVLNSQQYKKEIDIESVKNVVNLLRNIKSIYL